MTNQPFLTEQQLREQAPSIFAIHPASSVSNIYKFIPTTKVLDLLQKNGWNPVKVQEQRVTKQERMGFQKHMIRFRQNGGQKVGDVFPEIVLTNAHDTSASFVFHAGLFRLACTNGLVVAESTFGSMRLIHLGDVKKVNGITKKIVEGIPLIMNKVQLWEARNLSEGEQRAFALKAMLLRFESLEQSPVSLRKMLESRRPGDDGADLWRVFNRVQENMLQGAKDRSKLVIGDDGKVKTVGGTMREIKSIDQQVTINKKLWHLADVMAEVKNEAEFLEAVEK